MIRSCEYWAQKLAPGNRLRWFEFPSLMLHLVVCSACRIVQKQMHYIDHHWKWHLKKCSQHLKQQDIRAFEDEMIQVHKNKVG